MKMAKFISFWVGFCSLSLEIAWVRLYGFANASTPKAFAFVLMIYLIGIAFGAQVGKLICKLPRREKIEFWAVFVLIISVPIIISAPNIYHCSSVNALDQVMAPLAIFITAAALSVLFPITHHLGTSQGDSSKGKSFSKVYFLNVIGAALGPLVTGYILFENFSISQIFPIFGLVLGGVALISLFLVDTKKSFLLLSLNFLAIAFGLNSLINTNENKDKLTKSFSIVGDAKIISVKENRHGIITITEDVLSDKSIDHTVYGGNVYDGKVNVDLERNTNGLERPLALHVLQPKAKRALVLGLSIGSWLAVVEGFPGIEEIDVIEINSGYLDLAKNYEAQNRAISDKKVNIVVDDARRWLNYNSHLKYDLILMNTTWHWRANSSMLLSQEMMKIVNRHLNVDGVVAFNATGSIDAFYTASTVFKEVRRYQNFIYGSNWNSFDKMSNEKVWNALHNLKVNGLPGFSENTLKIKQFSSIPFIHLSEDVKKIKRLPELITDNNMLVEYKYGRDF